MLTTDGLLDITTFTVRSSAPLRRMRIAGHDNAVVDTGFLKKGPEKSAVTVQHQKRRERAAVDARKKASANRFDPFGEILTRSTLRSG